MKRSMVLLAALFVAGAAVAAVVLMQGGGFAVVDPECPDDVRFGVAFTIFREPVGDLAVLDEDAQITKITDDGRSFDPSFSPDGKQLAFTRGTSEYDDTGGFFTQSIVASNADGTGVRDLTDGRHLDLEPAWSPEGDVMAFTRGDLYPDGPRHQAGLMLVPADGGEPELLFARKGIEPSAPEWSPDGDQIAFVSNERIHVINEDGSGLRKVAAGVRVHSTVSWSSDGQTLAFAGSEGIYTLTLEDPNPRLWKSGSQFQYSPEFSPEGSHFLYIVEPTGSLRGDFEGSRAMVAPIDGGEQQILVNENALLIDGPVGIGGYGGKDWLNCR